MTVRLTCPEPGRRMDGGKNSPVVLEMEKSPAGLTLAPADCLWTTARDGAVKLRMEETGPASEPPVTTVQMFQETVQRYGNQPAMAVKRDGQWKTTTYLQYYEQCRAAAKSFLKLGLERFHGVGILGFNSPEWLIADIGAIMAGGLAVGIYNTSSAEVCQYVAENCKANILVVEDQQQLLKILQIEDQLLHLKAIVQYCGDLQMRRPNLFTWKEFMQLGTDIPDSKLDEILRSLKANQCCTMTYTSGTTGPPKGVMLSHDNVTWMIKTFGKHNGLHENEVMLSHLPLSHVGGQLYDIWLPMCVGGTTYFANPGALSEGSLVHMLKEVRPTMFFGVPRVWEKFQEVTEGMASCNFMNGNGRQWLADKLILKNIQTGLGLDRCTHCHSGAAPIMKETLEYFMGLNLQLMQLYGMSETFGPYMVSVQSNFRIGSCGKALPGCRTRIHMPDKDGVGEICSWGRNIFMGYLNREKETTDAFDQDGWLHSGDLGTFDQDGFLFVTGRIKEIIITSGGQNIPPVPIENALKKELPIISNAMLVGEGRKFPSLLITLKCSVDPVTGEPQDDLTPEAVHFCQKLGSGATRVSEVVSTKDPAIYDAVQKAMERVNLKALSNAQKVQKWTILKKDFSVAGGELGPTLKLRRSVVIEMYKESIEELYKF
ncbi:long-chain-fatty-acid--CoA ligase ACSBG2-like [Pleurodeles waltl]|uniref:long-chain-fatty-acid--CoA ligase ACSBG2-like n=1 Tax=Pleurodeles waltl TaxID=8319 RepID=UPI003709668F